MRLNSYNVPPKGLSLRINVFIIRINFQYVLYFFSSKLLSVLPIKLGLMRNSFTSHHPSSLLLWRKKWWHFRRTTPLISKSSKAGWILFPSVFVITGLLTQVVGILLLSSDPEIYLYRDVDSSSGIYSLSVLPTYL